CFSQPEVNRGLPAQLLVKYFHKRNGTWLVKEEIRRMVDFRQINLLEPWPALPVMDVILLRNVLIYFDVDSRKNVLAKVRRSLSADGCLILGGAETTLNLDDAFERVACEGSAFYRLRK